MPQEFRSIDGSGNNLQDVTLNATGTPMVRIGDAHFNSDGTILETVNPRVVSNQVVGQGNADVPNKEGLSEYIFAWGQFIDHDLDLLRSDGVTPIPITIPADDQFLTPGSTIPLTRSVVDAAGFAINNITGWLDGSMVYGSTKAVADSLRAPDGHLLTSDGDNLPLNAAGRMLAGDVRVQENPGLTSLQTLFVREHNFQVDQLAVQHPDWTAEELYQNARVIVGAEIANITNTEFLPKLTGHDLGKYHGYDPSVDPTITEEFAGAAYRFGHSTVTNESSHLDNFGAVVGPEIPLKDLFGLTAADFNADGGADAFLRHLGANSSLAFDSRIADGLRNFLADPRGQDLAAVNIQRGHDLGIGTLNETREALGLHPYKSFAQLTDDPGTLQALKDTFTDINQVDLWTGGLAEKHVKGGLLGQTFAEIISDQFEALRDGDRLYFENQLDKQEIKEIKATSLSDIIERNTDTDVMQSDVFTFTERHASDVAPEHPNAPQLIVGIDSGPTALTGGIKDDYLVAGQNLDQTMTGNKGADTFHFNAAEGQAAVVTDFKHADTIEIAGVPGAVDSFADLHVVNSKAGITIDAGDAHIVLAGVHHVNAHDFDFV